MAEGGAPSGGGPHLPDLRIVLLGNRESGKSLAGNTILGRKEFDPDVTTLQCVKRQGAVAGRQLTLVDTPGWADFDMPWLQASAKLLKQEIVLSVTLCPPGPHVFLLVIHENIPLKEAERHVMSNHLSLLGHGAWEHSLVLFIQETPAEQKDFVINGRMIPKLVENCGNRYHVLNIKNRDEMQVNELLEKIENLTNANSNRHYEIKRDIMDTIETKRKEITEKAMKIKLPPSFKPTTDTSSHLSDIRIVLLGSDTAGKSSSGNTILGREEFQPGRKSSVCLKRQGEVSGRHVTIVDTPGWWSHYDVEDSCEITKIAIQLSPGLCGQGPHALLLVMRPDMSFTEDQRTSAQQHLELLGEEVWSHTLVLFTHGDWLGDTPVEEYIESEGAALKEVLERCGNRYHLLNNQNSTDGRQVTELLQKIEDLVEGNSGQYFQVNKQVLMNVEEKMRIDETRAEERMIKMKKQHDLRPQQGQEHQSSLRILLLGFKYSGKSSTGNTILGKDVFELCSMSKGEKRQGKVSGRQVTVVTTPSWWSRQNMANVPTFFKQGTVLSVSLCDPGPHAVLLLISVDDAFHRQHSQNVQNYMNLFSEDVWSQTIVLFSYGDWLGETAIERYIESEGDDLKRLIEKCGGRYHVFNNKNKPGGKQVTELMEKIEEMVADNGGRHYEMDGWRKEEVMKRRGEDEERATARLMKVQEQRQHLQLLKGQLPPQSEFRIVLLGYRQSGKSSSGNSILDREEFDLKRTAQCVKRQGEVAGRQLTVVEAPGWWANENLKSTNELTKQEIALSVSLCPPGPHIILLHVRLVDAVSAGYVENMMEHVNHLTEAVWSHTMVLFTGGDWLGDTPIELYIESEGALQSLVEKCGNRYHVLNNRDKGDRKQITELLEKIQEIVCGNRGCHFEMDRKRLEEMEERRKLQMKKAEDRQASVYQQRNVLKFSHGDVPHLSEIRIVLVGLNNAGKSSSGNTILGREEFESGLRSAVCVKRQGVVAGRHVTVVDTPGWKTGNHRDTPNQTRKDISQTLPLCLPGPHALLLVICTDFCFTEDNRQSVRSHLNVLGANVWSHTIVAFTYGDWLGDTSIEEYIESEGECLTWVIEQCGNRYHVLNNKDRSGDKQVTELFEKIEEMLVRNGGHHYMKGKDNTEAPFLTEGAQARHLDPDELEMQRSMSEPLQMSVDNRSEIFTEETSAYSTCTSVEPSEALSEVPSEWGSQESIITLSSGISSMCSGASGGVLEQKEKPSWRRTLAQRLSLKNRSKKSKAKNQEMNTGEEVPVYRPHYT